jgi:hypothetical protein
MVRRIERLQRAPEDLVGIAQNANLSPNDR